MALYGTWTRYDLAGGTYIDTGVQLWGTVTLPYIGGRYIAIGQKSVMVSSDGVSWAEDLGLRTTLWDGTANSTAYYYNFVNNRHFLVGGSLFESTDNGYTWVKLCELGTTYLGGVAEGMSIAYDGSSSYVLSSSAADILTSTDCVTWTVQPHLLTLGSWGANIGSTFVYRIGASFVAVSNFGDCATSPTGVTWTNVTTLNTALGTGAAPDDIRFNGTTIVVVGYNSASTDNVAATSTNGTVWTSRTTLLNATGWNPAYVGYATSSTYVGSTVVFSTDTGDLVQTLDGTAWTRVSSSPLMSAGDNACYTAAGGGSLVQMFTALSTTLPSVYVTDSYVPVASDFIASPLLAARAEYHLLYATATFPATYSLSGGSDTDRGPWVPSSGAYLCEPINADRSLVDYIATESPGSCIIPLEGVAVPVGNVPTIKYAMSSVTMNTVTLTLKQGATVVATWSHSVSDIATEYLYTLPPTDRVKLTTGSSLSLTVTAV